MRREHANDDGFELLKLLARNQTLFNLQFGGEQTVQRVTLVHRERANHTARIRDGFEPLSLAWRQSHAILRSITRLRSKMPNQPVDIFLLFYLITSTTSPPINLPLIHSPS